MSKIVHRQFTFEFAFTLTDLSGQLYMNQPLYFAADFQTDKKGNAL